MRPAEYTTEEIIAAGEAIQAAGRNVTGFAIRQKVGGGNPTRLRQVWDEHLAGKQAAVVEPVAELPIEVAETVSLVAKGLSERIATLAVELNDKAVKAAERRVAEVVRSAGEQREQAERELADAAQTVDELEVMLEKKETECGTLNEKLAEKVLEAQQQAVELAQLRERLLSSEQALAEAKRELRQAAATAGDLTREAALSRENAARLAGQLEALQAQNAQLIAAFGSKDGA